MAGYGAMQSRYLSPDARQGDTFLGMKRSARKPNAVSQEIRNLQPGRAYSMKMYVAEYPGFTGEPQKHVVAVRIDAAEMIPEKGFQGIFSTTGHPQHPGERRYLNFCRWVFRPKGPTALLTLSDWATENEPGGPIGQELMVNFLEIEPYLMEEE